MNSIWLLATPRSGSNWLLTYFSMNGVYNLGESLYTEGEYQKRKNFYDKYAVLEDPNFTVSHLKQYLLALAAKNGDPLVMKMMGYALPPLMDRVKASGKPLNYIFGRISYVYLKRNDVLSQAISLNIAKQTQEWARADNKASNRQSVVFNLEAIKNSVAWIKDCYAKIDKFIAENKVNALVVDYDDLQNNTEHEVRRIFNHCELDDHQLKLETWLNIQRDNVNEAFYQSAKAAGL